MARDLRHQVVLLTGSTSLLGQAVAKKLALVGAKLALTSRDAVGLQMLAEELRQAGASVEPFPADLLQTAARQELVAAVARHFGRLDMLINLDRADASHPFQESTAEELRELTELNFFVPVELMRFAQPHLLHSVMNGGQPAILNVLRLTARVARAHHTAESGADHALLGFCEAVRAEFARFDIDVQWLYAETTTPALIEQSAAVLLRCLETQQREATVSWAGWWLTRLARLWPRRLRSRNRR